MDLLAVSILTAGLERRICETQPMRSEDMQRLERVTVRWKWWRKYHLLRGSAKQSVKDGLGSLWQHGNFNTSQLQNLSIYNDETLHV